MRMRGYFISWQVKATTQQCQGTNASRCCIHYVSPAMAPGESLAVCNKGLIVEVDRAC